MRRSPTIKCRQITRSKLAFGTFTELPFTDLALFHSLETSRNCVGTEFTRIAATKNSLGISELDARVFSTLRDFSTRENCVPQLRLSALLVRPRKARCHVFKHHENAVQLHAACRIESGDRDPNRALPANFVNLVHPRSQPVIFLPKFFLERSLDNCFPWTAIGIVLEVYSASSSISAISRFLDRVTTADPPIPDCKQPIFPTILVWSSLGARGKEIASNGQNISE